MKSAGFSGSLAIFYEANKTKYIMAVFTSKWHGNLGMCKDEEFEIVRNKRWLISWENQWTFEFFQALEETHRTSNETHGLCVEIQTKIIITRSGPRLEEKNAVGIGKLMVRT